MTSERPANIFGGTVEKKRSNFNKTMSDQKMYEEILLLNGIVETEGPNEVMDPPTLIRQDRILPIKIPPLSVDQIRQRIVIFLLED
jgi:hypothetical protein